MKNLQFVILITCIIGISCATDSSPCGEWKPYKDEKCFKIFDKLGSLSFVDAEVACSQQEAGASLVSIRSQQEQEFFSNFLFETSKVVDNVWIGAIRNKSNNNSIEFDWIDGFNFDYSNWEEGHPTNQDGKDCIQINSEDNFYYFQNSVSVKNLASAVGKWVDVSCQKKNLVVCEKLQNWPISRLQKILLDTRKEFQDSLKNQQIQQSMINNLKQNPVPINFIYTQLPGQPDPQSLWPTVVEWKDVTSEYSGHFFRAEGGDSAAFGTTQEDNAPRITKVEFGESTSGFGLVTLDPNSWSEWVYSGGYDGHWVPIRFFTSPGEVRPRNMAIRIWKRTE